MRALNIGPAWAGHPVQFALLTHPPHQFVAYYDADRILTVWQRRLDQQVGRAFQLPQQLGWDSHNGLALGLDQAGHLHLSGNMHVSPLVYYRSRHPFDAASLEPVAHLDPHLPHDRITYPVFLHDARRTLYFMYRYGSSGRGIHHIIRYTPQTQQWQPLLPQGLLDGQNQRSAYPETPWLGPDGRFHLVWIWRNSPDAATNHSPSYARSRDLEHWETSTGQLLSTPITLASSEVVDPVAPGGGAINNLVKVGLDAKGRPVVSYIKYDAQGNSQLYCSRKEAAGWRVYQITHWNWRWDFGGGGSLPFPLELGAVQPAGSQRLLLPFGRQGGSQGRWQLDAETLKVCKLLKPARPVPPNWQQPKLNFPGIQVHWVADQHQPSPFWLRWEALEPHRDQPRHSYPSSTPLHLIKHRQPSLPKTPPR